MASKRVLKVGLIGYKFMGKAHSNAWRQASRFFDLGAEVELKTICGRDKIAVRRAAKQLGWSQTETEWQRVVNDPDIDIIDICTPNDSHCQIAVAAAKAGKAILCEKPLARTVAEAERMAAAVKKAAVPNLVSFNSRRIPAVALARQMVEGGEIGDRIFHCRARYAQDWIVDPKFPLVWRLREGSAGSGAMRLRTLLRNKFRAPAPVPALIEPSRAIWVSRLCASIRFSGRRFRCRFGFWLNGPSFLLRRRRAELVRGHGRQAGIGGDRALRFLHHDASQLVRRG